jgi:hypothetical protein
MPPSHLAAASPPRSSRFLYFAEREEIAILHARGKGVREIARCIAQAASTVSRELRRNAATRSGGLEYRAVTAQWHADRAARRPKPARLAINAPLRTYVQDRLAGLIIAPNGAPVSGPDVSWKGRRHGRRQDRRWSRAWSPEQIARRLRLDFPEDATMRISHEAIYQALYVQGRGALRREPPGKTCWFVPCPILSRNGASGNPGAVHTITDALAGVIFTDVPQMALLEWLSDHRAFYTE